MMIQEACPDGHRLQSLLEEGGDRDEADELIQHLESCLACQEALQDLAAPPDVWASAARGLLDEARMEPALHGLVGRLKEEDLVLAEDGGYPFLRTTDKPGVLGLLDRYEVQAEIGRGGMGVVFKALDPDLNRVVAIKILSPWLASNATARRRFVREAKAIAAVGHDHIVTVHSVEATEGLPYLVMQYVAGESLQARIDRTGPLEVEEVVRIGYQTAAGLAAAHAQGLIHRDVKPANLLLENGVSRVKITDFGLARLSDDVGLTQTGVIAGTPEYMAPEQARGESLDHRADLFSLGSVLYACCTGVPPFRGSTALAVLARVNAEEPAPLRSLRPDVPVWLEAFVARLLAKNPAERFPSAAEVATLLEGYLAHLGQPALLPAPELPSSPLVPRPGRSMLPHLLSTRKGSLAVVGLVSVLGLFLAALLVRVLGSRAAPDVVRAANPAGAHAARGAGSLEPADGLVCLLVNKNSGRCLSVAGGSTAPGGGVVQGPKPEQARASERWTLLRTGNGFRLRNENSGLVLGIWGHNLNKGVQTLQLRDRAQSPDQHWLFESVEDSYLLRVVHSQFVLGIGQGSLEEGSKAIQWPHVPGVPDQCWELRPAYREEAYWPLKGEAENRSLFELIGPGTEQEVHFEPNGLRITLPPGSPKSLVTGVRSTFGVHGDFEITVAFEILQASSPAAPGKKTRFILAVPLDRPGYNTAHFSHAAQLKEAIEAPPKPQSEFQTWLTLWNEATGNNEAKFNSFPTEARTGRLRLVRSGSTLSFHAAEGRDGHFVLLQKYPFGDEDVKDIRLAGVIDDSRQGSLDVRITDLLIRADSLPNAPKSDLLEAAPAKTPSRVWLIGGASAVLVIVLLLAVSVGVKWYGRPGRSHEADTPADAPGADRVASAPDAPASVSLACSGCGKRLRVRAVLAGKKVKCPQCGQAVIVPSVQAGRSPE